MRIDTLLRQHVNKALAQSGGKVSPACRFLGISRATYYNWKRRGIHPSLAFAHPRLRNIIRAHVKNVLRRCDPTSADPFGGSGPRYGMVARAAAELGVSRSTLYAWASEWGWMNFGTIRYESGSSAYRRNRRRIVAGCGRAMAPLYGSPERAEYDAALRETRQGGIA